MYMCMSMSMSMYVHTYIYIYIYIYMGQGVGKRKGGGRQNSTEAPRKQACEPAQQIPKRARIRPISLLTLWISRGLTQA